MKKLFLFDCDETLWFSDNKDYVSSIESNFKLDASGSSVIRIKDGQVFSLNPHVHNLFDRIINSNGVIGILSDNRPEPVLAVLGLFGLQKYINMNAYNVRLWDGYCPKDTMVAEVLQRESFAALEANQVYWIDDKDYSQHANSLDVEFVHVKQPSDICKVLNK